LHISVLGVGFQVIEARRPNDVLRQDVASIAERGANPLRGAKPVEVALGPVNVFPDALILEVHDDGRLKEIRRALEGATRPDAFGFEESTFLPHTTIATFTDGSAADALREALPELRDRPAVPM